MLLEGLAQASNDYHVPQVVFYRDFWKFLEELPALVPENSLKLIAHPPVPSDGTTLESFHFHGHDLLRRENGSSMDSLPHYQAQSAVVAVGPEGGWTHDELRGFIARDFHTLSLGSRILRTDVAVPILLGLLNERQEMLRTCEENHRCPSKSKYLYIKR